MNSIRVLLRLVLPVFLFAAISPGALGAAADEVARAAEEGLPDMLGKIPPGAWSEYGFASGEELSEAAPGVPLPLFTITPAALNSYQPGDPADSLLSETTLWYVPVRVKESVRSFLVVDRMEGRWQAVSFGYAPLAKPVEAMLEQWPASAGYHPKLILVFQAQQYLFTIPELGGDNLIPLMGVRGEDPGYKAAPSRVIPVGETVSVLKPVVASHLAGR